ncbi:DNA-binding protein [gut metagenome]|uniref:DNA-binding protein n=1 Tax=gut metagenome TaxID=749906 RepID=J9GY57_9ZZZZ
MILYQKYQLKSGLTKAKGKFYARPVVNETLDLNALAKHMSYHNTPYSPGAIKGVLTDMVSCIKELVLDGKNVKLDNLAIFSCGIISAHGADRADDFKVSTHVKGVRLRARATGKLSNKSLNLEATLREQSEYLPVSTGLKKPAGSNTEQGGAHESTHGSSQGGKQGSTQGGDEITA